MENNSAAGPSSGDSGEPYTPRLLTETIEGFTSRMQTTSEGRRRKAISASTAPRASSGEFIRADGTLRPERTRARNREANRRFHSRRTARLEALAAANSNLLREVRDLKAVAAHQAAMIVIYCLLIRRCQSCNNLLLYCATRGAHGILHLTSVASGPAVAPARGFTINEILGLNES